MNQHSNKQGSLTKQFYQRQRDSATINDNKGFKKLTVDILSDLVMINYTLTTLF